MSGITGGPEAGRSLCKGCGEMSHDIALQSSDVHSCKAGSGWRICPKPLRLVGIKGPMWMPSPRAGPVGSWCCHLPKENMMLYKLLSVENPKTESQVTWQ